MGHRSKQPEKQMNHTTIETYGTVNLVVREDGKYGVEDSATGEIAFRYRTIEGARNIAAALAAENILKAAV
jgi:hypothetical protein